MPDTPKLSEIRERCENPHHAAKARHAIEDRRHLLALLARCRERLEEFEWSASDETEDFGSMICPECGGENPKHADNCDLSALLADLKE